MLYYTILFNEMEYTKSSRQKFISSYSPSSLMSVRTNFICEALR